MPATTLVLSMPRPEGLRPTGAPSPVERDRVFDVIRLGRKFLMSFQPSPKKLPGLTACRDARTPVINMLPIVSISTRIRVRVDMFLEPSSRHWP